MTGAGRGILGADCIQSLPANASNFDSVVEQDLGGFLGSQMM